MSKKLKILSILLIIILCCFTFLYCAKKPDSESEFYIYNLGIDIAPYSLKGIDVDSNNHIEKFLAFGEDVGHILPTFEYVLDKSFNVYSLCDGVVTRRVYQPETDDYEISIKPHNNNTWEVVLGFRAISC